MKKELINKYNEIFSDKNADYTYYSPNTVYNLIYHLDSLEDGNKKKQIVNELNDYLDFISENPIDNIEDSQTIFRKFLHPIIRYYVKKVGFISYGKPQILIPIFLTPSLIICYFFNSIIIRVGVCIFLVVSFIFNYQKNKSKKTYGLTW